MFLTIKVIMVTVVPSQSLCQHLDKNPDTVATGVLNVARDGLWGGQSVAATGFTMRATAAIPSSAAGMVSAPFLLQTASQMAYSTAAMAVVGIPAYYVYCKATGNKFEWKKVLTFLIAASLAIVLWNYGQALGIGLGNLIPTVGGVDIGKWIGGLILAPIFCGVLEGGIQFLVRYVADRKNKTDIDKQLFSKELKKNITWGAIPGAVWQMVFFIFTAVIFANFGGSIPTWAQAVITGTAISIAVCIANLATAKHIQEEMDKLKKEKEQLVTPTLVTEKNIAHFCRSHPGVQLGEEVFLASSIKNKITYK